MAQSGNTLGAMVGSFADNIWNPFWITLLGLGFLAGLWLVATGLGKFKDTGGHGSSHMDGLLRIIGGAFLLAIPNSIGIGIQTLYGGVGNHTLTGSNAPVGAVQDCLSSGGGITCVAQNVALNLVPAFVEVCFAILGLIGAIMIVQTIYSVATSAASGHHQPPKGWLTKIVIGILMSNIPYLFYLIQNTMGENSGTIGMNGFNRSSPMLAYVANTSNATLQQYQALIGWVFYILVMFGVISVWRGITQIKSFADGSERSGMGSGITHIIAGVMLANAKWTTCIVVTTMFGQNFGFC